MSNYEISAKLVINNKSAMKSLDDVITKLKNYNQANDRYSKSSRENNDKERILLIEKCFLLVSVIILYIDNSECFSLLEMSSILCFAISCLLLVCILCTRIYFAFKNRKSIENLK